MTPVDTLELSETLSKAGMPKSTAAGIARTFGVMNRNPFSTHSDWIQTQMEVVGLTAEQA